MARIKQWFYLEQLGCLLLGLTSRHCAAVEPIWVMEPIEVLEPIMVPVSGPQYRAARTRYV